MSTCSASVPSIVLIGSCTLFSATLWNTHIALALTGSEPDVTHAAQSQNGGATYVNVKNEISNKIGMVLRMIPPGEFDMGSLESDGDADYDEKPQHKVRITRPFLLGKCEVTQREFQLVMGRNPSWFSSSGGGKANVAGLDTGRFPVEYVNWYDAVEFCNKLSETENVKAYYGLTSVERYPDKGVIKANVTILGGRGYRVPTEAEWEYACRAGSRMPFHFGKANNGRNSNINGRDPYGTTEKGPHLDRTTSVGTYAANQFGLHDMHGNVDEWCQDQYDDKYYIHSMTDNPLCSASGVGRVIRGGSWLNPGAASRSACRYRVPVNHLSQILGFRVAADIPQRTQ